MRKLMTMVSCALMVFALTSCNFVTEVPNESILFINLEEGER